MGMHLRIAAAIIVALIISLGATPIVKTFAHRVGAIDIPNDARRVHKHPIPRLGGLAIFIGFLLSVVFFAEIDRQVQGILLGAVLMVVIGVIDDIVPVHALLKFFVQIAAALIAVHHGVQIYMFSNPNVFSDVAYVSLGIMTIPVTVLWIVAITNAVNLIDGLDGLAVGVSAISSVVVLTIALMVADLNVAVIMAALVGACLGFMPHNFNPAKIFMGDTGALLLGYVLATVSIIGLFKFYAVVSFAVPFLVLALPLFDTAFAFIRRLVKGQNPMSPDRGHFHHRLIDMGLSQKQAVAILYAISGLLGLSAVVITTSGEIRAGILIISVLLAAFVVYYIYKGKNGNKNGDNPQSHDDEAGINPVDTLDNTEEEQPMEEAQHTEGEQPKAPAEAEKTSAERDLPE